MAIERTNRNVLIGLAATVVGGIFLYRNRFAVQRRMESIGISTPLLGQEVGERSRSFFSRMFGRVEHVGKRVMEESERRRAA